MFLAFRCLMLVVFACRLILCPPDDHCHRQTFNEISNRSYTGDVLIREGPWPVTKCRRLCRRYLECWFFTIVWANDKYGTCNIYHGVWNSTQIVQKQDVSLYVPCPDGFQWNIKVKRCYTAEIYGPIQGYDAVNSCANILPGSFPVEPRNNAQMNHIKEVGGNFSIWLGMRKPDNFSDVHEFRYYSDGMPLEFEYWFQHNPNNFNNNEYCVVTTPENDHRWNDVKCILRRNLLCQL
ncbi:hypothetical protein LSH36_1134g00004 [Paralvinella palmiformis]|uniref:C-type lectin domain-containing protein n=1 Tax=Paralvinella palmiformis TaxID=53620 RepID=A0AAD9IVC3_9ANNE|nr:hypothetical protein LSH36_1134g00004 [Paralvinella palmiformis]